MRILKFINQQLIKDTNMKHLYTSIYHNPGISRAHLSQTDRFKQNDGIDLN